MTRNRLAADDLAEAGTSLEEGLFEAKRHGHCVTCNALLLPEAVRVALATEDIKAARRYANELEEIASDFESEAWVAMASHGTGRVLLAERKSKQAVEKLERARNAYQNIGQGYERARSQLDLAKAVSMSNAKGQKALAKQLEAEAHEILRELGAPGEGAS